MKRGFTLVELLVAIGLFSVIVAIAAGGFTNALRTQREVAGLIAAQSNASLALEQMAREIRTGYLFCHAVGGTTPTTCTCPGAVPGQPWSCNDLDFYNADGVEVHYELTGGALEKGTPGSFQAITGDNVNVAHLSFFLQGQYEDDHWNPRITIAMGVAASSTDPALKNDVLDLQTTVSARAIDCNSSGC